MQLISYNINGIRAALRNGLADWLGRNDFDILCFQEVKATADQVDLTPFDQLGYQYHWHAAEKKGYSGVATFSRVAPDNVVMGCGIGTYDCEGRILRTDFNDLTVLNCYVPSGTTGEVRQAVKLEFLRDFYDYVQTLRIERPNLIVVGDYNIAHRPIDLYDPVRNKNTTGFRPEERAWMDRWLASGMIDTFRDKHPDERAYSWWSYHPGARSGNKGWRIDYTCVTTPLRDRIVDCRMLPDAVHADHCPVLLTLSECANE